MQPEAFESKSAMRARVAGAIASVPEASIASWSAAVRARLDAMAEFRSARVVMGFLPIAGEVDLMALLERAIVSGKRVGLPRVDWASRQMRAIEVGDLVADVELTRHGIREPRAGLPMVSWEELDLVLVPGLAFDASGGRLGRGGGFYDRFLAWPGLRAVKIGVGFECQIVGAVERQGHDVGMDAVVTEGRVVRA